MKKTLSFFLAAIMLFAFSSVAFAADVNFTLTAYVDDELETEIEAVNAGDTFVLMIDAGSKKIKSLAAMIGYDNSAFEILVDEADLGSHLGAIIDKGEYFTFGGVNTTTKKVEAYVTIKVKDNAVTGDYDFEFLGCDEEFINGSNGDVTYGCDTLTVSVNGVAGGDDEPEVNTVVPSDVASVTADTINGEATDYQIGSGLGMTVSTDATFNKMKWAITTAEGRLFSKTIALPNVTGEFKVAATFINGSHENEFGKEVVAPVEFSEVGAIFSDGEADYFTNADDAALKAE